jgi:hypothetical protein
VSETDHAARRFPTRRRQWLAFLLPGPIAGAMAGLAFGLTVGNQFVFFQQLDDYSIVPASASYIAGMLAFCVLGGALQGLIYGTLAMLLLGAPAHLFLRARTSAGATVYALAGLVAGAIFTLVIAAPIAFNATGLPFLMIGAGTGLVASLTFWLIRRPDRDNLPDLPTDPTHEQKG